MRYRESSGGSVNRKFFREQLIIYDSIKELLKQAFILVYKVGLTATDVNKMTSLERNYYFEFLTEDIEAQNDIIKRNRLS